MNTLLQTAQISDEMYKNTLALAGGEWNDDAFSLGKLGISTIVSEVCQRDDFRVDKYLIDAIIEKIDSIISKQVNDVLHHPLFQAAESAWRGVRFLVDRCDFSENIEVVILPCSKQELLDDFQGATDITKSGLYKIVYSAEYGQFGGKPFGAVIANYDFSPRATDVELLKNVASVAAMSHAPFLAAAGPEFFGISSFADLPAIRDIKSVFEGPQLLKYNALRDTEDAKYVGLLLPKFLLRLPYGADTRSNSLFDFCEDVSNGHNDYCWGNPAFAFASRLTDSFAKYRWCPNIIGPQSGGAVSDLPIYCFEAMGSLQTKIPTESLITERLEMELSELGFIAMTYRKSADEACFFSANSIQKPKFYGQSREGKEAELNYRLGGQLPYLLIACRLAHYLKVLQREQIGAWKDKKDLEKELSQWIGQYVADQEFVTPTIRSRRPLRTIKLNVREVEGNAGYYEIDLQVRPHFKYMGASFTLSLVGRLDKQ